MVRELVPTRFLSQFASGLLHHHRTYHPVERRDYTNLRLRNILPLAPERIEDVRPRWQVDVRVPVHVFFFPVQRLAPYLLFVASETVVPSPDYWNVSWSVYGWIGTYSDSARTQRPRLHRPDTYDLQFPSGT
jgi:hypothetical protein